VFSVSLSREFFDKLWAVRRKRFPKPKFKPNPIQAELNKRTQGVMAEVLDGRPRHVIQAVQDLAKYMKTIGMGPDSFQAIMQNLEIMSEKAGRPKGEIRRYLRNRQYYEGQSRIMVL